jgi:hypothetical protein
MATPEEMAATMRANLKDKTGKTSAEWLSMLKQSGLDKHGKIVAHLKSEHQVTHGFANLIAHDYLNPETSSEDDLIELQYSKKPDLKPLYDALIQKLVDFSELEISPKKTYVSLRRNKQFGLIQPSTKTRLDIGLNLKGEVATIRLEESGSFNQMVSHRVRVTDINQIDDELIGWLKKAYQLS